jgi:hypothetical protein
MKNINETFLKIHALSREITNLSFEAMKSESEKEKDRYMNKIIDAAEAIEDLYTTNWH